MHVTNQHNLPELSSLNDRYGQQLASDTSEAKECFAMAENIERNYFCVWKVLLL